MNAKYLKFLIPVLLCAAGCATSQPVVMSESVGPRPGLVAKNSGDGFLQVYSARKRVPTDVNAEEFFWNNDFGRNEFLYRNAHTGYTLYAPDGRRLQWVPNSTGMNDATPTSVKLPPGVYKIKAQAVDFSDVDLTVTIPVRIESGLTTSVHLDNRWHPSTGNKIGELVRLPNGHAVGWHAPV
jgi:hypothetical protein